VFRVTSDKYKAQRAEYIAEGLKFLHSARELVVEGLYPVHHNVLGEFFAEEGAAVRSERRGEGRVFEECMYSPGQGIVVAARDEESVLAVPDDFADAADVRRNYGLRGRHVFEERERKAFSFGGEDADAEDGKGVFYILNEAREYTVSFYAEPGGNGFQLLPPDAVADDEEAGVASLFEYLLRRAEEDLVRLFFSEGGRNADDRGVGLKSQPLLERGV